MDPMTWWLIGSLIISLWLGVRAARAAKQQSNIQAGQIEAPQSVEGTPQGVIFGDAWISSWMVLAMGNERTTPIKVKTGKK